MRRIVHASIVVAVATTAVVAASCDDTTDLAPSQLDFNRPIDVAFACYGGLRITNGGAATVDQTIVSSAQPYQACDIRSGPIDEGSAAPVPPGQEDLTAMMGLPLPAVQWYGFVLQSEPGTVGIVSWLTKPALEFTGGDITVQDPDPLTPGKSGIAIGELPVGIATDPIGCYLASANAGTCDMSTLDITSALDADPAVNVSQLTVMNSSGQALRAKPSAIIGTPATGTIGVQCPATATGLVYVAYPRCHLVAAVDLSSGVVKAGISYDSSGVPSIIPDVSTLSCPDECGGGVTTAGIEPSSLDLQLDPNSSRRLLAIGAPNSNAVTLVELDINNLPASLSQIAYSSQDPTSPIGITNLAITPQIGMGGSDGSINDDSAKGGQFQFVYAIATDNTVRVADILSLRKECDTQVDPRLIDSDQDVKQLSCFPVGDPATPARRPGARGPGIELVGHATPTSVAAFKVDTYPDDTRAADCADPSYCPTKLVGYFAVVTSADGASYIVNIDDDDFADYKNQSAPLSTPMSQTLAHQLRDGIQQRGLLSTEQDPSCTGSSCAQVQVCDNAGPDPDASTGNTGGPRTPVAPAATLPAGYVSNAKSGELPSIRTVECQSEIDAPNGTPISELMFSAPVAVRDLEFPDLRGLRSDETWTLTYQGDLSGDTIDTAANGPPIREAQMFVTSDGMELSDPSGPFCSTGVEPYDIVQFRGCDPTLGDSDCPLGYTCYVHPDSQITNLGACMLSYEADRLADACKEFLISLRRYTVGHATTGELVLLPRTHVLRTSPLDGCTSDAQCQMLADYALQNNSSVDPVDDTTAPDTHTWACQADANRKPGIGPDGDPLRRCIEACATDTDCDAGTVCQNGSCMEGIEPPQSCVNSSQRFELRASEAFTVTGTQSGFIHPIIADAAGNCVTDPTASPFQVGRIPLSAPACDPNADPRTGLKGDGTYDANPCSLTTNQFEVDNQFQPTTCAGPSAMLQTRAAPALRFHNRGMTLTLVDPTYPGDARCLGDRAGGLDDVPMVPDGYSLSFRQTAGFLPLTLAIAPAFPIKVVRGPSESIWVIDDGDYISTDVTLPSTEGKLFRIETIALSIINIME